MPFHEKIKGKVTEATNKLKMKLQQMRQDRTKKQEAVEKAKVQDAVREAREKEAEALALSKKQKEALKPKKDVSTRGRLKSRKKQLEDLQNEMDKRATPSVKRLVREKGLTRSPGD